jgi:hypothetical protein
MVTDPWQCKRSGFTNFSRSWFTHAKGLQHTGFRQSPSRALVFLTITTTLWNRCYYFLFSHRRKLRLREAKYLTSNHHTRKYHSVERPQNLRCYPLPCHVSGAGVARLENMGWGVGTEEVMLTPHCPSLSKCYEIKAWSLPLPQSPLSLGKTAKRFTWKDSGGKW